MLEFVVIDRTVEQALARLSILLSDEGLATWLGLTMGPYLKEKGEKTFAQEGLGDEPWAPLKPATLAIRQDSGHPINRRTGELENWVVGSGWDAYPIAKGATLRFPGKKPSGELKDKVETAQRGREYPRTVPRPVIGLDEADLLFFQTALAFSIQEAMQ